ncbi:unnamed protein product [Rotaria magnacalcarata]|uniref:Uncharacterized protein n=1 Tax=Rotaria magnacalcarata TaxID=392030 RepID=A0A819J517_9BILA|nr:unnamed protein product [Rotaria magnacalcarata]CAF3924622.1 unnamed protein product [Rotaria magnacalcarata]
MILLTTIDRFVSTTAEVRYRSFSQLKVAYRVAPIVIIVSLLSSTHMLVFYGSYPSCTAQSGTYAIIYSVHLTIWTGATATRMTTEQRRTQKTESQLIVMMLSQANLSSCFNLIRIALYAYFVLTTTVPKSNYHRTVDGLLL